MAKDTMKPRSMQPTRKPVAAPSPASPIDIMNLMGDAADRKARMNVQPTDEEDSLNSMSPKSPGGKSPASTRQKKTAAIKAKQKQVGAGITNTDSE